MTVIMIIAGEGLINNDDDDDHVSFMVKTMTSAMAKTRKEDRKENGKLQKIQTMVMSVVAVG